ncbi:MAG: ribose-5-phosphate isomerase RpiA [bacterium]|jgi:ribose 5-phosphate isomerase A|nr:ribose-5-phosphate isomerase RpiA [candidate division KSB1 bacterium]MDH7559763.1 ribose-5-phosphate isomerase RpiA [bacterium]
MGSEELKRQAGEFAVRFVEPGMVVGLGHGSTAIYAVRLLATKVKTGELHGIVGVPCSRAVEEEATRLGIPLTALEERLEVDLTIDGADEVSPSLDVIKGGGGALLREKVVAQASKREVIVVDESKLTPVLGRGPLPVEVIPFGWKTHLPFLQELGAQATLRLAADGVPSVTDQGNLILDCIFAGGIREPHSVAAALDARAGIVGHGLFLNLVTDVVVATHTGIRHYTGRVDGGRAW